MRYFVAWILGVPFSVIVLWYIVGSRPLRFLFLTGLF
jgi:hypothetical protein